MITELTSCVGAGNELQPGQVGEAVAALADPAVAVEAKAGFLTALARRGETPAEIAAFADRLRDRAVPVPLSAAIRAGEILDVCGTGGDRLNTFNISTTVALVCAAAGVVVAKHGNRAITSRSGSADVLEALGIPVDLTPEQAGQAMERHGFAFLFAPRFHPAFQHIGPARRLCAERGQPTLFNFLGPLLNPARPTVQLLGVSRPALTAPLAATLRTLGLRRAMVVSGEVPGHGWLDELSTLGPTTLTEFHQDRAISTSTWSPDGFPLRPATLADLAGGDAMENAAIITRLLEGGDEGPRRDAVLLNAGAALFLAGRSRSIAEGWEVAEAVLRDGRAGRKLADLRGG